MIMYHKHIPLSAFQPSAKRLSSKCHCESW